MHFEVQQDTFFPLFVSSRNDKADHRFVFYNSDMKRRCGDLRKTSFEPNVLKIQRLKSP